MAVTPVKPETATGIGESAPPPLPSWPRPFAPQHFTDPLDRSAQENSPPAETAATPVRPETATGIGESVFVLLPSWPKAFHPKHSTVPPWRSAQVL